MITKKNITFLFKEDMLTKYKSVKKLTDVGISMFESSFEINNFIRSGNIVVFVNPETRSMYHINGQRKGLIENY